MSQQKQFLSLYALPDGGDYNAAEIDSPDWESSVLYEKDQAKHAYDQMTHAVAWAILSDFSDGYAVAYWELDKDGYSACLGIRTIKFNDPVLISEDVLAQAKQELATIRMSHPGGFVGFVPQAPAEDYVAKLLTRVQQAEAQAARPSLHTQQLEAQLTPGSPTERAPTQWAYEQACAAIEEHRKRADAAEALLTQAAEAMAGSYDVTEWPANGSTPLDTALKAIHDYQATSNE